MDKPWSDCKWLDFNKAAAIVIPHRFKPHWKGFYLPAENREQSIDLELPEGKYSICTDFDFDNPRTDYDRACKALQGHTHALLPVGQGKAMVLGGIGEVTFFSGATLIVFRYAGLPDLEHVDDFAWEEELVWEPGDTGLTLMNACDHGADPHHGEDDGIELQLDRGRYSVASAGNANWFRLRRLPD